MNTGAASLSDERINELALLNLGYDRAIRPLDFARAIEREVRASTPQADAAPKKASLGMVARLIADHYASKPDDHVISIGDWRDDPILGAPMREFVAYLQMPLGDFRAAIAAGGAQEPVATRAEIEHARDRVIAQSKNSLFRSGAKICAAEILSPTKPCTKPPEGWTCSRIDGHEGPCAASPAASNGEQA
jgi:hypothetical protein